MKMKKVWNLHNHRLLCALWFAVGQLVMTVYILLLCTVIAQFIFRGNMDWRLAGILWCSACLVMFLGHLWAGYINALGVDVKKLVQATKYCRNNVKSLTFGLIGR